MKIVLFPNSQSRFLNKTFDIAILLSGPETVNAAQMTLTWNSLLVDFVDSDFSNSSMSIEAEKSIGLSSIIMARGALPPGITGEHLFGIISFRAKDVGIGTFLVLPDAQILQASDNTNVFSGVENAQVLISGDTLAPQSPEIIKIER